MKMKTLSFFLCLIVIHAVVKGNSALYPSASPPHTSYLLLSRLSRGTGRVFSKDHGIVPTLSICLFKRPRVHRSPVLYTKTLLIASHVLPPLGCVHLLVSFHVRVYQHPRLLADPSCLFHRLDLPHVKTTDQAHDQT